MIKRILLSIALLGAYSLHAAKETKQDETIEMFARSINHGEYEQFKLEFTKYCTEAHFTNQNVNKTRKALLRIGKKAKANFEAELQAFGTEKRNFKKLTLGTVLLAGAAWSGLNFLALVYSIIKKGDYQESMAKLEANTGKVLPWLLLPVSQLSRGLWYMATTNQSKEAALKVTFGSMVLTPLMCGGLSYLAIENIVQGIDYRAYLQNKIKQTGAIVEFLTNFQ